MKKMLRKTAEVAIAMIRIRTKIKIGKRSRNLSLRKKMKRSSMTEQSKCNVFGLRQQSG